jgi:hypothetical protein
MPVSGWFSLCDTALPAQLSAGTGRTFSIKPTQVSDAHNMMCRAFDTSSF